MPLQFTAAFKARMPGLAVALLVAAAAYLLRGVPPFDRFSPLILAIVLGTALANAVRLSAQVEPGLQWTMRPLLRLGIVLLGLQITPAKLMVLGLGGMVTVVLTLALTFWVTVRVGRWLGIRRELAELIAAGTSVCGASAVIAVNSISRGSREDIANAVAAVTLFGTLSMLLFPALGPLLHLSAHSYGLWSGAAIHEIAQVVAAGFQGGPEAGEFATIAKLARVAMLGPLVLGLGAMRSHRGTEGEGGKVAFPWFVAGFLAMVALGGVVDLGAQGLKMASMMTTFLLTVALGAMGLMVNLRELTKEGWRPMVLATFSWIFVSCLSLVLVEVLAIGAP